MTSTENLLGPLDDDQREAVVADPTPLVVFAGAGSGKTRVLSTRVAYMIDQGWVPADELFVTAFTKAAADEMQERIEALDVNTEGLNVGTFHSLLFRFLNADRFNKGQRRLNVAKQAQVKIAVTGMLGKPSRDFPKALNVEADLAGVLGLIGQWKNALVHDYDQQIADTRDAAPFGTDMWAAAHVYPMYQEWLADQGLLDFDDMLLMSYDLLATDAAALRRAREQWTGFLIDEAQDTNIAQWGIIRLLADPAESPNLTIVGDVRQALYRFRGATPELMEQFPKIYGGARKIDLTKNYRSTGEIIRRSNRLISGFSLPDQVPHRDDGSDAIVAFFDDQADQGQEIARMVQAARDEGHKGGDIAVLIRTNAQSAEVESAMVAAGLPYWCRNGGFFSRMEVGDIMAYLRLAHTRDDEAALKRIINKPTRYLGAAFVDAVARTAKTQGLDLVDAIEMTDSYRNKKLFGKQKEAAVALAALLTEIGPDEEGRSPTPFAAIRKILDSTDYLDWLRTSTGTSEGADDSRKENLDALIEVASHYGTIEHLLAFADESERLQQESGDATQISTVHRAKGREWPIVFVTNFYQNGLPHKRAIEEGGLEDERRIAYVAFTRAQDVLIIGIPRIDDKGMPVQPSQFLADAEFDVVDVPSDDDLADDWWGELLAREAPVPVG